MEAGDQRAGMQWPDWWAWDLEITPHIKKRMLDRDFTEVELRQMLEDSSNYRPDFVEGRWVIETRYHGEPWEIIVEPDERSQLLIVITAYPTSEMP